MLLKQVFCPPEPPCRTSAPIKKSRSACSTTLISRIFTTMSRPNLIPHWPQNAAKTSGRLSSQSQVASKALAFRRGFYFPIQIVGQVMTDGFGPPSVEDGLHNNILQFDHHHILSFGGHYQPPSIYHRWGGPRWDFHVDRRFSSVFTLPHQWLHASGPSLLGVVPPLDLLPWSTTLGGPAAGLRPPSSYCPWECFSFFWLPLNPIFSFQLASFGSAELPLARLDYCWNKSSSNLHTSIPSWDIEGVSHLKDLPPTSRSRKSRNTGSNPTVLNTGTDTHSLPKSCYRVSFFFTFFFSLPPIVFPHLK